MENLLTHLNAQIKFIKKYKVEEDSLLSISTLQHSSRLTLYIGRGNSNRIMSKLIEEGYEFEKSKSEGLDWLEYRIDFDNVDGLEINFIKEREKS
jgi:hypothetical protein